MRRSRPFGAPYVRILNVSSAERASWALHRLTTPGDMRVGALARLVGPYRGQATLRASAARMKCGVRVAIVGRPSHPEQRHKILEFLSRGEATGIGEFEHQGENLGIAPGLERKSMRALQQVRIEFLQADHANILARKEPRCALCVARLPHNGSAKCNGDCAERPEIAVAQKRP